MLNQKQPSFITLLLLISFASVNAVLFTPALPNITHYFKITDNITQLTITLFLVGYTLGQLFYSPIANRFGRKKALYLGISLQIISNLICLSAGIFYNFHLFVWGRFLTALGAGVGLKMTFTIINECYPPRIASQKISYLTLAFAITPGLGVAFGGILNANFGWQSCFYASLVYGFILLLLVKKLPETQKHPEPNALHLSMLFHHYFIQFKNRPLVLNSFIVSIATCFIYIFAAIAPFVAMKLFGMKEMYYGLANLIPSLGLMLGSLFSAHLVKTHPLEKIIQHGIIIVTFSSFVMFAETMMPFPAFSTLFIPMFGIYFGLSLIFANASTLAMNTTEDKAHGSAVMNFINIGVATVAVYGLSYFSISKYTLPITYIIISAFALLLFNRLRTN